MNTKELEKIPEISLDDIINSIPVEDSSNSVNEENYSDLDENQILDEIKADSSEISDIEIMDILDESKIIDSEDDEFNILNNETVEDTYDEDNIFDETDEEIHRYKPKKRRKKRRGRLIFGLTLTMIIVGTAVFCAVTILKYSKELLGIDKPDISIAIEIPYGVSSKEIAEILYNEGIINEINLFRFFSKVKGTDGLYISGIHEFMPKMSYGDIVDELMKGAEEVRQTADVTFPEGITLFEAAKRLEEKGVCSAKEFIKAFNTSDFGFSFEEHIKVNSMKFYKMEGYLFPDTYRFYIDEDPRVVVKKIYKNFNAKITPDIYGRMNDLEMTLEEVLTLASIVQAEAAYKSDMKLVASVFFNRLNNPDEYPLLQSDPTTKYVNEVIKPNIEVNSEAMYKAYDTYQGAGLPPGPICNPGLEAINAVLYPSESDYFYFCSNIGTGEFFYSKTLAEHEANLIEAGLV